MHLGNVTFVKVAFVVLHLFIGSMGKFFMPVSQGAPVLRVYFVGDNGINTPMNREPLFGCRTVGGCLYHVHLYCTNAPHNSSARDNKDLMVVTAVFMMFKIAVVEPKFDNQLLQSNLHPFHLSNPAF